MYYGYVVVVTLLNGVYKPTNIYNWRAPVCRKPVEHHDRANCNMLQLQLGQLPSIAAEHVLTRLWWNNTSKISATTTPDGSRTNLANGFRKLIPSIPSQF